MSLPLIAAGAGASALSNLHSSKNGPTGTPANQSINFQQLMAAMQQNGVSLKDLMALSGPALQAKLGSLTPQEQQALAQKLYGSTLGVKDPTGATLHGTVTGVHLEGKNPSFDIAGINYGLNTIQSIDQIPT